jgi:hypothetical protein
MSNYQLVKKDFVPWKLAYLAKIRINEYITSISAYLYVRPEINMGPNVLVSVMG